ncbi:protein phyllopod [Episyrphus balteatus]|uniref:protein phyllopod n=1 Tax=Episyrphus balteatus TaxID=286459 RepID=UPI002485F96C|nr:protein phyllopod [Episyrphus balteatus]
MSEKSSEYHKKTCIICGCHTNQTINIYEPRSGPNIVRLIQARFKFQPLNEDKYLCYSCNNWLINWHSLQALNSNDADNPSGTFRSSQINNMVAEKGSPSEANNSMKNSTKPVAQVRPQLKNQPELNNVSHLLPKRPPTSQSTTTKTSKRSEYYYLSKRTFPSCHRLKRTHKRKTLHNCCVCGRTITRRILTNSSKAKVTGVKCKRCRDTIHWRNMYLKTLLLQKKQELTNKTKSPSVRQNHVNLVNSQTPMHNTNVSTSQMPYQPRQYQKPLVDGKVVSMLRRLGTTLSRDSTTSTTYQPPIMSPAKKKSQKWTRNIADNEIVINFNTAITEVLPIRHIRRKLTYQISDTVVPTLDSIEIDSSDEEEETDNAMGEEVKMNEKINCDINLEQVYNLLPKGLTVSLISDSESILVN